MSEIGKKYGRLTVISEHGQGHHGEILWLCDCECGNRKTVPGSALRSGKTLSCGCLQAENARIMGLSHLGKESPAKTHGLSKTRIYKIWSGMIQRCNNPKREHYANYGGRGITVCAEWINDFISFYVWSIENGYADNLTIDRIDNDGNYCPNNCRWSTAKKQCNNRSTCRFVEHNGKYQTVAQWGVEMGVSKYTLYNRLNRSKSIFLGGD